MMLERVKNFGRSAYKVLKWPYRVLNFLVRIVLLLGVVYSICFSLAGTYVIYKAATFAYEFYEEVDTLRYGEPELSSYMKALQDSSPSLEIKHKYVPLDSISPYLQRAVIASEDAGFYYHPGFDIRAIAEAMAQNQARGKTRFGGSTITQQLAKNLFLSGEKTWTRKAKEIGYALMMEKLLGKRRILELYLNYAQWGQNMFGCEVACEAYYKKSCSTLTLDQAIGLAAVLASPGKHNPHMRNSKFMESRRSVIYQNMFAPKEKDVADSLMEFSQQQARLLSGEALEGSEVAPVAEEEGFNAVDSGSGTLEEPAGEPAEAGAELEESASEPEAPETEAGGQDQAAEAPESAAAAPEPAAEAAPAEEPEAEEVVPQGSDGVEAFLLEPRELAAPAEESVLEPETEGGSQTKTEARIQELQAAPTQAQQHSESVSAIFTEQKETPMAAVEAALEAPNEPAEAGE